MGHAGHDPAPEGDHTRIAHRLAALLAVGLAASPAVGGTADDLVVRFTPGVGPDRRIEVLADAGVTAGPALGVSHTRMVSADGPSDRADALRSLREAPEVAWAEPVAVYRSFAVPNDPLFVRQWGLRNTGQDVAGTPGVPGADVGAVAAWDRTTGDAGVTVAVVDSGLAAGHPDLAPNISPVIPGRDLVDDDADPQDVEGHGSIVAGIIAGRGDDGVGTAGVAWRAGLVGVRVLTGSGTGTSANIAEAFRYAGQRGVRIVNASLGGAVPSQAVADAVAANPGTLFVVAAGNAGVDVDGLGNAVYPCVLPDNNVICVAASTAADTLMPESNWGARSVDLAAPGDHIWGPTPAYLAPVVADDFTGDLAARWVRDPSSGWGVETLPDGSAVLSDSPAGPYAADRSDPIALANPVTLTGMSGCRLFMRIRIDARSGDGVAVEGSGGAGWRQLGSFGGSTHGRFEEVSTYLGPFDGQPGVSLRLRFVSDVDGQADGVQIAALRVACQGGPYDEGDYAVESGTSFAAPHVSGAAALVMARYPSLSAAQVKRAILDGVTPVPAMAGKLVSGGRLSIPGALDAAARIAAGATGGTPQPQQTGGVTAVPANTVTTPTELRVSLARPTHRHGVWGVGVTVLPGGIAEVRLERRVVALGGRGTAWRRVRTLGPGNRSGVARVSLGRLARGAYRVSLLLPDRGIMRRRAFAVPGR